MLSGHFHTSLDLRELENGGKFVYPGSPISHGWKELGRRQAVLVDTDDETLKGIHLNTFYLDKFEKTIRPEEKTNL